MDIAALSIMNAQTQVQSNAGILLLKKAIDTSETNSQQMIDMLVPPSASVGTQIDITI